MVKEYTSQNGQVYWVTTARDLLFPEPGETVPLEESLEDPEPATTLGVIGKAFYLDMQALTAAFPEVRFNESSRTVAAWGVGRTGFNGTPERGLEVYVRNRPGPGGIRVVKFSADTVDLVSFPIGQKLDPLEVERIMIGLMTSW